MSKYFCKEGVYKLLAAYVYDMILSWILGSKNVFVCVMWLSWISLLVVNHVMVIVYFCLRLSQGLQDQVKKLQEEITRKNEVHLTTKCFSSTQVLPTSTP